MKKIILIPVLAILLIGCKAKKTTLQDTAEPPNMDDYNYTASYAFILLCDSAAKFTAQSIADSTFEIIYSKQINNLFNFYNSLDKNGQVEALKNEVRAIYSQTLLEMNQMPVRFYVIGENDNPKEFLEREIMANRLIEPNLDSIENWIKTQMHLHMKLRRATKILEDMNTLYSSYYENSAPALFDYSITANTIAYQYLLQARDAELKVKKSYLLWDDKKAIYFMQTLK